jgi:hypothetical protein
LLIGKWDGTGQGQVKERGKDMDTFDKVPSTRGKSYYNKQERDWWHQANLPEKLDYDYSEMVLSGTHTPHEYQSLVYARFAYTNDPSHRCSNPNPNRPVAFDEMEGGGIGKMIIP